MRDSWILKIQKASYSVSPDERFDIISVPVKPSIKILKTFINYVKRLAILNLQMALTLRGIVGF